MTEWLEVTERSAVAEARRRAMAVADATGLNARDRERAAIVATEAATNLLKHAGRGRFTIFRHGDGGRPALSIIAVDKGPGIADLDRMSQDGQSTTGSSGTGLGAMNRLSDVFDIYTTAQGTALTARIAARDDSSYAEPPVDIGALMETYPGSAVCGDSWSVRREADAATVMVCDGLGHGSGAHEAAEACRAAFEAAAEASPAAMLTTMSQAAMHTRGAVAMIAHIRRDAPEMTVSGIGNIAGIVARNGAARRLASRDGRLGGPVPRVRDMTETLAPEETLILHSDGLRTLRDVESRSGLMIRAPLTIAATLLRDDPRGNDDACVLVARRVRATAVADV